MRDLIFDYKMDDLNLRHKLCAIVKLNNNFCQKQLAQSLVSQKTVILWPHISLKQHLFVHISRNISKVPCFIFYKRYCPRYLSVETCVHGAGIYTMADLRYIKSTCHENNIFSNSSKN